MDKNRKSGYNRAYYTARAEELKAKALAYGTAHKEEKRASNASYYAAHVEERAEWWHAYYHAHCPEIAERAKRNYAERRGVISERGLVRRAEHRRRIIEHYGGKCACCGEESPEFLALDHINGDGSEQRKLHGSGGTFYAWVIKNGFPDDLRLLCYNCNMALGIYGYCPHALGSEEPKAEETWS